MKPQPKAQNWTEAVISSVNYIYDDTTGVLTAHYEYNDTKFNPTVSEFRTKVTFIHDGISMINLQGSLLKEKTLKDFFNL
jgi:hypothetical protein